VTKDHLSFSLIFHELERLQHLFNGDLKLFYLETFMSTIINDIVAVMSIFFILDLDLRSVSIIFIPIKARNNHICLNVVVFAAEDDLFKGGSESHDVLVSPVEHKVVLIWLGYLGDGSQLRLVLPVILPQHRKGNRVEDGDWSKFIQMRG